MRNFFALSMAMILIGASAACGPSKSHHDDGGTQAEKDQALRDSTFGPMVGAMDRAKGVEQLQEDRKGNLDAALEN